MNLDREQLARDVARDPRVLGIDLALVLRVTDAVLALVEPEIDRLTKLSKLQRAALDVWKTAYPHVEHPIPGPTNCASPTCIAECDRLRKQVRVLREALMRFQGELNRQSCYACDGPNRDGDGVRQHNPNCYVEDALARTEPQS